MRHLLVIIFILTTTTVYSQKKQIVPGYRGLKFSVKYDLGLNLSWLDLNSASMPVIFQNAELAYVLTRRTELSVRYARNDFNSSAKNFTQEKSGLITYTALDKYQYIGNSASIIFKNFATYRGYIAPVGRYTLFGVKYLHAVHLIPFSQETLIDEDFSQIEWGKKKITTHDFFITLGLGRNIILANRLILSIEGLVNVPVSGLIKLDTELEDGPFLTDVNADNMLKNLFQFKIGLGVLAF
jgi:hypothetical protein